MNILLYLKLIARNWWRNKMYFFISLSSLTIGLACTNLLVTFFIHEYNIESTNPIAYTVMKQWVETYNRQTDIGIWPFMLVLVIMVLIIMISISNRVWKAANENPADVVKSE